MVPVGVLPETKFGTDTLSAVAEKLTPHANPPEETFLQVVAVTSAGTETASSVAAPAAAWNSVPPPQPQPHGMVTTLPPGGRVTLTPLGYKAAPTPSGAGRNR